MGLQNFVMLFVGIPAVYGTALAIVLFEKSQNWMEILQREFVNASGVGADKYSILILLISIILWNLVFFLSTYVAAYYRDKAWDNSTTRDVPEKQVGVRYSTLINTKLSIHKIIYKLQHVTS